MNTECYENKNAEALNIGNIEGNRMSNFQVRSTRSLQSKRLNKIEEKFISD